MVEGDRVASWVWSLLRADTGSGGVNTLVSGRIYRDLVPQAAALPAVVITAGASLDNAAIGGGRVTSQVTLLLRVVGEGASYAVIRPIADRIDALLQGASGASGSVQIGKLLRETTEQYLETSDGVTYADIVQIYRALAYGYA